MYESVHIGDTGTSSNGTGKVKGTIDGWRIANNRFDLPVGDFDPASRVVNSVFCGNTGQVSAGWTTPCS